MRPNTLRPAVGPNSRPAMRPAFLSFACLLATLATVAWGAGPAGLQREAEAIGRAFVDAANTSDPAVRLAAVRAIYADETLKKRGEAELLAGFDRLAREWAPLELHHSEAVATPAGEATRYSLHVFAKSARDGRWHDFQFILDPQPPHRVDRLVFIAEVAAPVYLPNGAITDDATRAWLDGYIDRLVADDDLSGALMIAVGGEPIFERYFGFADAARSVPCTPDTRFNLGSGNKMFTALAVAQLVAEGKLSYETTLDRFVPDHLDPEWKRTARIGHILSHTSGAGEYWTPETTEELRRVNTLRDFLPLIERAGIDFAPGTGCRYSNSNFILAGLVIEAATGRDYHDVIRERIYTPCGMADSDTYWMDGSVPGLAEPLTGKPRAWQAAGHGRRGSSAGGGFSTPRDILRFGRALVEGRIVGLPVLAEMTRSHTAHVPDADLDYGYGFILQSDAGGTRSFGHGGIAPGINFEYRYFPASDVTLIAFCNQDNGAYDSLRMTATKLITGDR